MAVRITTYADAFSLIGADVTPELRTMIKNMESKGHTEKSICFAIWKQQDKLRAFTDRKNFLGILYNEILKYSWPKGDIRWDKYREKKNEEKKAIALYEQQRLEEEANKHKGFVYFIQGQCGGAIKIGFSFKPAERLKSLQTGYPDTLTILTMVPGTVELERQIHEEFDHCRLNGEWFKPEQQLLDKIGLLK